MNQKNYYSIIFVVGILFAIIAAFIMLSGADELLPLSITFLIIGIVLISGSPVLRNRLNS